MIKALIFPAIIVAIGIASYTKVLYFPFAVALVMLIFMGLLFYLNYISGPDFPTTEKKKKRKSNLIFF